MNLPFFMPIFCFPARLLLNIKKEKKSDIEEWVDLKEVYGCGPKHYLAKVLAVSEISKGKDCQDS